MYKIILLASCAAVAVYGTAVNDKIRQNARNHHHSTEINLKQAMDPNLYHDCIGCDMVDKYFCGDPVSPNYGNCSDAPFASCAANTWIGTIENYDKCFSRFRGPFNVDMWPSCFGSDDSSLTIGKISVKSNVTGIFIQGMLPGDTLEFNLESSNCHAYRV
jgi:hypothetical protein